MDARRWLDAQRRLAGPWLPLAVGCAGAGGLLVILQAWLLAGIVDGVGFRGANRSQVSPELWLLLGVFGARALCAWGAEAAAVLGGARIEVALRDRLYRHLQGLGPQWLADQRTGSLTGDLIQGIAGLTPYFTRFLPALALTLVIPLGILLVAFPIDWLAALILLLTAPLIPFFTVLIGQRAERLNRAQWQALARLGGHFLDSLQGLTTLKLFNASRRETQAIAQVSEDYRRSTMGVLRVAFLSSAVLELFASLGLALVAVFVGFRLYGLQLPLPAWEALPEIGFRQGFFMLLLAPEFYQPLRHLGTHYHARLAATTAAERVRAILETPLPVAGTARLDPGMDASLQIRFQAVHFSYAPGRPALAGAEFQLQAGEWVALVGPSGAGKTTVLQLLLGFVRPDAGQILINGIDLSTLDLADWRRALAWVPQSPHLFQGTLLDNLRLGVPDAPLDLVREAARQARAAEFIESLPQGYLTRLGEGGAGLSGGQIQRLALARAFLRRAPLAILDEPTASLDPASEAAVQAGIAELARGRTLLTVAHRLATAQRADRILVLDRGRVVEAGTHGELLARGGLYGRLASASLAPAAGRS